jgi:hypothetical protein
MQTLYNLRRVFDLEQVYSEEAIVRGQVQRRGFAGSEMFSICMKGILDFLNRMGEPGRARFASLRMLSVTTIPRNSNSCVPDVPTKYCSIFECLEQVPRWQLFSQCLFNPVSDLVCGFGGISVHAELPHVLVEGRNRSHDSVNSRVSLSGCCVVSLQVWRKDSVTWTRQARTGQDRL